MGITIVLPVSRSENLQRLFASLELAPCDTSQVSILTLVHGDQTLFEKARNLTEQSKFSQRLCVYLSKGLPNTSGTRARRKKIAEIHNKAKQYIGQTDYILSIEDDCDLPINLLNKLYAHATNYPFAGIITGNQIGRWGFNVMGVWKVNDPYNIQTITSCLPQDKTVEEIDASGLYCALIKKDVYMSHTFEPYEYILGPDFNLGIYARTQGYKNYVDWSLHIGHVTKKGIITKDNTTLQTITFERQERGWKQSVI
jgi:hypothetical protein